MHRFMVQAFKDPPFWSNTHLHCHSLYEQVKCWTNSVGPLYQSLLWGLAWADIQRQGFILAWIVTLSVYGADTIAIDNSLSALIFWFMKSIIGFLNNYNLHAIFSTLLIINLHGVKKFILLYWKKFKTVLVSSFNLSQSFNYTSFLFYKKPFKSEINYFCIWTLAYLPLENNTVVVNPLGLVAAEVQDQVKQGRRLDECHQVRTLSEHQKKDGYTVKKGLPFSRPKPGCHWSNSP